ncbi:MAG TPA: hypothetical protein VEJ84_07815 [Acidimicrobiales bacterium]|nr:hypothetical protein [Acidimicrobiales bacterium]
MQHRRLGPVAVRPCGTSLRVGGWGVTVGEPTGGLGTPATDSADGSVCAMQGDSNLVVYTTRVA